MNINLTPEQTEEFKELLADLKQEATALPQTYKYKFNKPTADIKSNNFYYEENLKFEKDFYRPVSTSKSPAPSASNLMCNSLPLNSVEDFKNLYLKMKTETSDRKSQKVPIKGVQPTKTVLKYNKKPKG